MKIKTCALCKVDKPFDDYYNNRSKKDGKREECKDCNKKINQSPHTKEVKRTYYHKVLKYKDNTAIRQKYYAKKAKNTKMDRDERFKQLLATATGEVGQVPCQPDYYISQFGDVYSRKHIKKLNPRINEDGYLVVKISNKSISIHRLVMLVFCGPPPSKGMQVNHIDGNKQNNSIDNLEYVTQKENLYHAMKLGIHSRSFRPCKLIDPNGVEHITDNLSEFCRSHNLQQTNMWKVLHGKRPHHLGWRGAFI